MHDSRLVTSIRHEALLTMNTPDQPADALQAKINVSVANARVLVSSWLPTALAPVRGDSEAPKQETQEITHIKNGHPSPLLHRCGQLTCWSRFY